MALLILLEIAVFCVAMIICADAARGWLGERLLIKRAHNQSLWMLLAFAAMMSLAISVVFVATGFDPRTFRDRPGGSKSLIEGGSGIVVMLTWVAIGFRRLRQRGDESQTLNAARLLTRAVWPRRSKT